MKKIFAAATAILAVSAISANAADLPARTYTKAPPMMEPIYNWTGFYIGGQVGYDWRRNSNTERFIVSGLPDGFSASSRPEGVVGGVHAGYNIQTGAFVFGVEADIEGADIRGRGQYRLNGGAPITDNVYNRTDWQGSFRGRAGFAANNWLFYATGGVAWADMRHDYVTGIAGPPITSFRETRVGYTVGGGIEYGFTPNWSARIEYRYSDYGRLTNNVGTQFVGGLQDQSITDNAVRGGITYRFGGPLVARY